jgi:hypothetical protein
MAVGVNIVSTFDSKGISKAIKDFQKLEGAGNKATFGLRTFDKSITNGIKNLAKFGAVAAIAGGIIAKSLISSASTLQESISKINAVFGSSSKTIIAWSQTTAKALGISQQKALEAAGTYGNLFQAFGIGAPEAQQMSVRLVELAADMASFNNVPIDDALLALRSGLSGETEPLKKFGVALNEAALKNKALEMGLISTTKGTLPQAIKTQAAYALILEQTSIQQGDVARTSDGVAFKMKSFGAQVEDIKSKIGTALIPIFSALMSFLNDKVIPVFVEFSNIIGEKGVGAAFKFLGGKALDVTTNMGALGNTILALTTAFVALRAVSIAAAIAQNLFNVALLANPIGITIAYFIAMGVILAGLYIKFAVVREAVGMIGTALKFVFMNTVALVFNYFVTYINVAITGINILIKAANLFGADIEEVGKLGYMAFSGIGSAAKSAKAEISGVAERTGAMAAKEGGVQKVVQSLKDVASAAGSGSGGAAKAVETATQKLEKYIDALKGLTSAQRSYRDAGKAALKSDQDLLTAKNRLVTAQTKFNNVLNGYGANSVQAGDAQSELAKAQREVTRAGFDVQKSVFAVADAEKELRDAYASGNSQQITEAQIALSEAQLAVSDATDAQQDSVKNLTTKQTLLDEAINGAATSSDTFKDAAQELKDAQDGLVDATDQQTDAYERQKDMLDALNESTRKAIKLRGGVVPKDAVAAETKVGVSPMAGASGGLYGSFIQAVQALHPNAPSLSSKTPVADSRLAFPKLYAQYKAAGLAMAQGGIVTQPTQILAGESGAEAIIPLDRLQSGSTINITVNAGMGSDGTRIGQMIVNELQAYQRRVGSLPLKVSS